jgi:hypothetical protein
MLSCSAKKEFEKAEQLLGEIAQVEELIVTQYEALEAVSGEYGIDHHLIFTHLNIPLKKSLAPANQEYKQQMMDAMKAMLE